MTKSVQTASLLGIARLQIGRRSRQVSGILTTEGYRGIIRRARSKASDLLRPSEVVWEVIPEDVMAADITRPLATAAVPKVAPGEPISVNWVMVFP